MNGVEAVAQILKREGVEYLFSYPNNPLIEAAAQLDIRPIVARTEKTLINMADGFCRATNGRRPAVITVQEGPGIENAFGGIAQAFSDSVPLLMLPGGPAQRQIGLPAQFDPIPPYSHVTKWAARVTTVDRIPEMYRRAFTLLRNGQGGPVLLELPRDVGSADASGIAREVEAYEPARRFRSAGDPQDVAAAARLLLEAQRPLIHAGHGVLWAEATDELRELAELVRVPVMTTMAGKSAFPEDHPLAAGAGGNTIHGAAGHLLKEADLVFGVGCSFTRGSFSSPIPPAKTLVQITNDERDLDKHYAVAQAVIGDAKLVLRQLIEEIQRQGGAAVRKGKDDLALTVRATREQFLEEWRPRLTSDETPLNPYRVIWELMHALDRRNSIVTHDSGNPRDQILPFFETLVPRGYIGWGKSTQLGTGLGVALGAKLAFPERTVCNVMGDLAFGTAGMEVETAVRERIPIMTVLLNNSRMGGYDHHMPVASERYGANLLSGSYADMAKALGAHAERVEQPSDIGPALRRGIAATREGRPVVLEMITKQEYVFSSSRYLAEA